MKSTKNVLSLLVLGTVLGSTTGQYAMAIEETKYTVVLKDKSFEVRQYVPHVVAETLVAGSLEQASNIAFRRLFKYITGANISSQSIAMTAPVNLSKSSEKISMTAPVSVQGSQGQWLVNFAMPVSYTLDTLPQPKDATVTLRQMPALHRVSMRYSGRWTQKNDQLHLAKLQQWASQQQYTVVGQPVWARYNAPFTPWFLRRNEVLLPIAWDEKS